MAIKTTDLDSNQLHCLIVELREIIDQARTFIATTANAELTMLYWRIGERIRKEILKNERADYGRRIVASVARQLTLHYGKGFSEKGLRRMIQFGEIFSDKDLVASLIRRLSWTHFVVLLPIKDHIKRNFYAEMCRIENCSVRTLEMKMASMYFERTALAKLPEQIAHAEINTLRKEDQLTPDL